jgi:hypothetical protein
MQAEKERNILGELDLWIVGDGSKLTCGKNFGSDAKNKATTKLELGTKSRRAKHWREFA